MISRKAFAILVALVLSAGSTMARADGDVDPAVVKKLLGQDAHHPVTVKALKSDDALRLSMNHDQIIRLNQDAASVIVNNPAHAEVVLDSPRLLIIMPRQPGATSFTVLNANSETILKRDIIVTNTQPKYVRIRRMCGADPSCTPSAYYYCPDGCYEVTPVGEAAAGGMAGGGSGGAVPAPQGPAVSASSGAQPSAPAVPAASGAAVTGGGTSLPTAGSAPDAGHPVGSDGEPLTSPGQKP